MEKEEEGGNLNKESNSSINRGFELMLIHNSRREKALKPKTFMLHFGKMFSLFHREIHFNFEISFDIRKK